MVLTKNNNNKHYTVEHLFVQIHLPLYVYQNQKSPVVPYGTDYKQQQQTLHSRTFVCTDPSSSLYLSDQKSPVAPYSTDYKQQ